VEVQLHTFLTSALAGGEWSASHPGRFSLREKAPVQNGQEARRGPRAGPDAVAKRKVPPPAGTQNRRHCNKTNIT